MDKNLLLEKISLLQEQEEIRNCIERAIQNGIFSLEDIFGEYEDYVSLKQIH